jgi:hypothetical protein
MSNYTSDANYANSSSDAGAAISPIYEQIESLDKRLETTYQEFLTLLKRLSPVLTIQGDDAKESGPSPREAGMSPLHERLITLNTKASTFARAVSETHNRITV